MHPWLADSQIRNPSPEQFPFSELSLFSSKETVPRLFLLHSRPKQRPLEAVEETLVNVFLSRQMVLLCRCRSFSPVIYSYIAAFPFLSIVELPWKLPNNYLSNKKLRAEDKKIHAACKKKVETS